MKNIFKYTLIVGGIVVIGYFAYVIAQTVKYKHKVDMSKDPDRFRFFKPSAIERMDPYIYCDYNRTSDVIYHFKEDKNNCYIKIWEFNNLSHLNFNDVPFNLNISIDSIEFKSGEVLNSGKSPEITVSFEPFFDKGIEINIDKYSKPEKEIRGEHYHGYIGWINRFSMSNEKGNHLVLFNNRFDFKKCMVLAYNSRGKFYIVIFYSENDFDESMADILVE